MNEVVIACLGIVSAVGLFVLQQRAAARERLRQHFADALADVYRWAELPYRVRRRSPAPEGRYLASERISDLQERLQQHSAWLRIESRGVHRAFVSLRDTVKAQTLVSLQDAWKAEPIAADEGMSVGSSGADFSGEVGSYSDAVRRHLRWYVWVLWR